ncbi:MAG: HD domain-containing protein [Acidimicrobiales bacterium]|nr:HD domain-containing protein [Acidimicrobiales bacterium]
MKEFHDVDELVDHLRALGGTPSVETGAFSELDHGLQCAALLQRDHPDDVELQVAGLVHDLAHPWDGPGQPRHGAIGAAAVRPVLGDRVAALVAGHVTAKRYLVTVDPGYRSMLSSDSIATLAAQGGGLSPGEVEAFRAQPGWEAAVQLRRADDGAKVAGADVPGLDHWIDAIRAVAGTRGHR